ERVHRVRRDVSAHASSFVAGRALERLLRRIERRGARTLPDVATTSEVCATTSEVCAACRGSFDTAGHLLRTAGDAAGNLRCALRARAALCNAFEGVTGSLREIA